MTESKRENAIVIREERAADYDAVYSVVKCAFQSAAHSDGHEQELVAALRKSEAFVPELSLVAEIDGKIVGHILFSKLMVGTDTELALAPLSVLPAYQRRGIGLALIREGHRIAKALGYRYSVVLGSETYYPQAGYRRAEKFGIQSPFDVPPENYMACDLQGDSGPAEGVVRYPEAFGI